MFSPVFQKMYENKSGKLTLNVVDYFSEDFMILRETMKPV